MNATMRDNIIFGAPFDETRFQDAIRASCLQPDIDVLPAGVDTEIGEKGINLSGGQKARVSFARAVYRDADLYLLGMLQ
jgi:ABC-type multidrug transport system fused ATPase/permease subunit